MNNCYQIPSKLFELVIVVINHFSKEQKSNNYISSIFHKFREDSKAEILLISFPKFGTMVRKSDNKNEMINKELDELENLQWIDGELDFKEIPLNKLLVQLTNVCGVLK